MDFPGGKVGLRVFVRMRQVFKISYCITASISVRIKTRRKYTMFTLVSILQWLLRTRLLSSSGSLRAGTKIMFMFFVA